MRCALSYDKENRFADQKLCAWGEMQSLEEAPAYREDEIEDEKEAAYYRGFKAGIDEAISDLDYLLEDEAISKEDYEYLVKLFTGELAMQLFSILDYQEE